MKTKVIISLICYALAVILMVAYFMVDCHGKKADRPFEPCLSEGAAKEAGSPQSGAAQGIVVIRTDVSDTQPILYQTYYF